MDKSSTYEVLDHVNGLPTDVKGKNPNKPQLLRLLQMIQGKHYEEKQGDEFFWQFDLGLHLPGYNLEDPRLALA